MIFVNGVSYPYDVTVIQGTSNDNHMIVWRVMMKNRMNRK